MHIHTDRHGADAPRGRRVRRSLAPASRRGSTLSMALLLVMAAGLVSVLTLQRGLTQWKAQAASSSQKLAFYMAEAGLAEAIDDLRAGGSGNVGTRDVPAVFGDGGFWVESVEDAHEVVHVTSTGLHGGTAYRLSQAIQRPKLPVGDHGFFGSFGVSVGEDVTIDVLELEDDAGEAEPPPAEEPSGGGRTRIALPAPTPLPQGLLNLLGSNGDIDLGSAVEVVGSIVPGPGGLVGLAAGALVDGSILPERELRLLPEIAMPVGNPTGSVVLGTRGAQTLASGTHDLSEITVGPGSRLTIVGPASVRVESLDLQLSARLVLDTVDGPVHLYVGDHVVLGPNSAVQNTSGDASDAVFLVAGRGFEDRDGDGADDGPVTWLTTNEFVGSLYAPNAPVALPAGSRVQGAITALKLHVGDGSHLTYDPRSAEVELRSKRFRFLSWRVVEIPAAEKKLIRKDLVKAALERGDTPPPAAQARIAALNEYRIQTPKGEELVYKGTSLSDLTSALVDAVLPPEVKVSEVPEFTKYEDDLSDDREDPEEVFEEAYETMLSYMKSCGTSSVDRWIDVLETGDIPTDVYDRVVVGGEIGEPFLTALKEPALREDLRSNLTSSWLPAMSRRFLDALIANYP